MKTNSSAKKRFKLTAKGRVKRKQAYLRHNLSAQDVGRKRKLRRGAYVSKTQEHQIKAMLPYGTSPRNPSQERKKSTQCLAQKVDYKSTRHRRNRIREARQGLPRRRSKLWKAAVEAVHRKWRFAFFHRRKRKPDFRGLWIMRINAAARELRHQVLAADRGARQGEHRARSQDPRGPRDQRSGRVQEGRRDGARGLARPRERYAPRRTAGDCPALTSERSSIVAELDRLAGEFAGEIGALADRAGDPRSRRRATWARRARSPS